MTVEDKIKLLRKLTSGKVYITFGENNVFSLACDNDPGVEINDVLNLEDLVNQALSQLKYVIETDVESIEAEIDNSQIYLNNLKSLLAEIG